MFARQRLGAQANTRASVSADESVSARRFVADKRDNCDCGGSGAGRLGRRHADVGER
jgi:hypothetical protein